MSSTYKPEGYTSVAPYLVVGDAAQCIEFMRETFGAVELLRVPNDDGSIRHASVRIDDTVVMLADALPNWPPTSAHVHVYVPDVDTTYRIALTAGATAVQSPVQKDDDDKRGGFTDPGGITWWVGTRVR